MSAKTKQTEVVKELPLTLTFFFARSLKKSVMVLPKFLFSK